MTDKQRFEKLRKRVMNAIKREIERDGGHKSYEGTLEWTICYPNYFEDETATQGPCFYQLTLHCYVLGPSRHYTWDGNTMAEALDNAERDIYQWTRGVAQNDAQRIIPALLSQSRD